MSRPSLLVVIANHGTKNRRFLDILLDEYRAMPYDTDLVILSDQPKALGDDVEVRVGAPTDNPRSLPFAYREVFAERRGRYDLYIYSEDDTHLRAHHIDAFLEVDPLLGDDEIPGFLRFENHPSGERSYCSIHSGYRWDPASVREQAGEVFAAYSNAHAACVILTSSQLDRALASGGFSIPPHEGYYGMLEAAATDPYVRCDLTRLICVSRVDDFLIHHLPDVYLGNLGVDEVEFGAQLEALTDIARGKLRPDVLLETTSQLPTSYWDVPQHPKPTDTLRELAGGARTILTIGCTSGRLERELGGPDAEIVAIPIDEVTAAVARTRDIVTLPPEFHEAYARLGTREFDLVLLHGIAHHLPDPEEVVRRAARFVGPGGRLVLSVPNVTFQRLRRFLRRRSVPPLPVTGYSADGVHRTDVRSVRAWLRRAGLTDLRIEVEPTETAPPLATRLPAGFASFLGREIVAMGRSPR